MSNMRVFLLMMVFLCRVQIILESFNPFRGKLSKDWMSYINEKRDNPLSEEEIKVLIDEIINSEIMPTCPHGRPIAVAITKDYIEKQFKRIV